MTATAKQIGLIRHLLGEKGYDRNLTHVGAWARDLGLTMRERSGRLDQIDKTTASKLIDNLKAL